MAIIILSIVRDTVLAILTHNFSALRCSNGTVTPMRMLIKHMPGIYGIIISARVIRHNIIGS